MHPFLLRSRWLTIHSYSAMLCVGLVFGMYVQEWAAARIGLDPVRTSLGTLLLLGPALFGARVLYALPRWRVYRADPRRLLRTSAGGAALYGGILVAVPLSVPVLARLGLSVSGFWDSVPFVALPGMIVGRMGCLLSGCCSGAPSDGRFALRLPDQDGTCRRRVPNQLFEALWTLVVFAAVLASELVHPVRGALFAYALGAYALGRFVLEGGRERQDRIRGVALHRAISLAFATTALVAFVASRQAR